MNFKALRSELTQATRRKIQSADGRNQAFFAVNSRRRNADESGETRTRRSQSAPRCFDCKKIHESRTSVFGFDSGRQHRFDESC